MSMRAGLLAVALITLGVAACGSGSTGPDDDGMGMPDDPPMVIQNDGKGR
jgi:hypothetical protein